MENCFVTLAGFQVVLRSTSVKRIQSIGDGNIVGVSSKGIHKIMKRLPEIKKFIGLYSERPRTCNCTDIL